MHSGQSALMVKQTCQQALVADTLIFSQGRQQRHIIGTPIRIGRLRSGTQPGYGNHFLKGRLVERMFGKRVKVFQLDMRYHYLIRVHRQRLMPGLLRVKIHYL